MTSKQAFCFSLITLLALVTLLSPASTSAQAGSPPISARASAIFSKIRGPLEQELAARKLRLGQPIFIRIFKLEGTLEVWMKKEGRYHLFKEYPICQYSGYPGPKLKEGDWQSPEGFYTVSGRQMNPNSRYHLSFDIGYPNDFDRARKRTGSSIMVHGGCSSRGCFAMGDDNIEEIYLLAHAALASGQPAFAVHIFPFRLTARNLFKFRSSPWIGFWKKLQPGYLAFEQQRLPPEIVVRNGKYFLADSNLRVAMASGSGKTEHHD